MIFNAISRTMLCSFAISSVLSWLSMAAHGSTLPAPWQHQDIGAMEVPGSAAIQGDIFTLAGTLDTWSTNDGFHFVFQKLRGDGEIVARVLTVENTMAHAKAGVMMRESLAAGAPHAQACVTPVDGAQFLVRTKADDKTAAFHTGANKGKLPYWIKLVRSGEKFSGFESLDGESWNLIGATNIIMAPEVYIGVTASSHVKTKLSTSKLDHVVVKTQR